MSEKFWRRSDEWYGFASCYGVLDFTVPPEREDDGPTSDPSRVRSICAACTVRPECARAAADGKWNDVWVCGEWIPGHDVDRREANAVRDRLADSIERELHARGDDV